jgi:PAS domain S-box-containing protein
MITMVVILLILINASIFGFWIWQQRVRLYRNQLKSESSIRELEERFTTAFRMSPVSVTISSVSDNKFIDVNNTFLEDMEYKREDVIGRTAKELNIWVDKGEREWIINEISEKGKVFGKVISYKTRTGKILYGLSSMSVIKVNGEPCNLSTVVNITESRKSEEKLIESEELFRKLFENMLNGFAYCKMICENGKPLDFVYLNVNEAFATLTGLKEVTGKKVSEAIPGIQNVDPELLERYNRVSSTGIPEVFETYVESLKMWFAISVYSPQKGYFVAVFDVITARKLSEEKLNESRATLRSIIDNSNSLIYLVDAEGRFVMVNQPLQNLLNPSGEQMIGQTRESFLPKEIADLHRKNDLEVITSGKTLIFEEENIEPDGKHFYLTTKFPLFDNENNIYAVGGLSTDITERKVAEDALRDSEERFSKSFRTSPISFMIANMEDGRIIEVNDAFTRISGFTREETIGNTTLKMKIWAHVEDREHMIHSVREGKAFLHKETMLRSKNGNIAIVLLSAQVIKLANKNCILSSIEDITERKHAEEALQESEERFRSMANSIPQLAWVAHADGFIYWYNKRWYQYTGTTPEQMEGWGWQIVHDPTFLPKVMENWTASIASGQQFEMSFPLRGADGQFRTFLTRVYPFKDSEGRVVQWFGTNTDVETLKQAEEIINKHNEELEQKVMQRTGLLEAANKELEAFSYSVSHDLRAPLRSVNGFTKILLEDYGAMLDEEGRRICGIISSSASQMGELIDDLLNFSRIGRTSLNHSPIDMKKMTRVIYEGITSPAERNRIELKIGKLHNSFGDVKLLGQVWTNLISNAIKYTSKNETAKISVGSTSSDNMITYCIKDNGVGFDMQYAHKLFGVFQRLHSETEFEGNGVGLAIVQRIILKHGGKVWAEGESGKGATFFFSLPVIGTVSQVPGSGSLDPGFGKLS